MYNLIYSEEVDRDLTAIFNYIAEDSEIRASEYLGKIEACILICKRIPSWEGLESTLNFKDSA